MVVDITSQRWFVMTHRDMKRFNEWLKQENARRLSKEETIIEPFYPRDFLKGQAEGEDLANFVFLRTTEADIANIVDNQQHVSSFMRLRYYLDTDGKRASVPDKMMQEFLQACMKYSGRFEITPPISSIEAMDKVKIKNGPFAGQEASVTQVNLSKGAIHLELAIQLVSGVMNIRMNNVTKSQIIILNRNTADSIRTDFIEYTQDHLLTILAHRIKRIDDEEVNQRDADTLTRLFRYRFYEIKNEAARTHFLALMIICAHLCRYTAEETALREKALGILEQINKKSESKAATDTRTYLWIALYISTHDPAYRDAAKQYVHDHKPKSAKLRRFVSLIRSGKKV